MDVICRREGAERRRNAHSLNESYSSILLLLPPPQSVSRVHKINEGFRGVTRDTPGGFAAFISIRRRAHALNTTSLRACATTKTRATENWLIGCLYA